MSNNPVAIVTGASRGVGKAVALNFAKLGYDVALVARNEELLNAVSDEIKTNYKVNTGIFALDVSDKLKVDSAVKKIIDAHGHIDVLFNNAGILYSGTSELSPEEFNEMYQVNVMGMFNFIHATAPYFKKQKSGYIMNIASMAAKRALGGSGGYAASKSAMMGFNESLFNEMLEYDVKVTALCPSVIATDMTVNFENFPNEEKIQVDDIVATVNFLLKLGPKATIKDIDILNTYFSKVEANISLPKK
jgi:short-subunit dehydrogenase